MLLTSRSVRTEFSLSNGGESFDSSLNCSADLQLSPFEADVNELAKISRYRAHRSKESQNNLSPSENISESNVFRDQMRSRSWVVVNNRVEIVESPLKIDN